MKFVELKQSLKNGLKRVYFFVGNDRFVLHSAIMQLEKAVGLSLPDVNKVVFDGERGASESEIIDSLCAVPFGDQYKLVEVWTDNLKVDYSKIEKFIKSSSDFPYVLLFITAGESGGDALKKLKSVVEVVECNKLDEDTIKKWIVASLNKSNIQINLDALNLLVSYTALNMTRISTEVEKLSSVGEKVVTKELVEKYVVPEKEYQIYELTDAISKMQKTRAFDILQTMLEQEKFSLGLLSYLYTSLRRLFLISISNDSDEGLAQKFGIKPFAVKMARQQAQKFSPRQLKKINTLLSSSEWGIKSGTLNQTDVLDELLCRIFIILETK